MREKGEIQTYNKYGLFINFRRFFRENRVEGGKSVSCVMLCVIMIMSESK